MKDFILIEEPTAMEKAKQMVMILEIEYKQKQAKTLHRMSIGILTGSLFILAGKLLKK